MTGEEIAFAAERIFGSGAKDVSFSPVFMKKGRPGTRFTVLCRPENRDAALRAAFAETTEPVPAVTEEMPAESNATEDAATEAPATRNADDSTALAYGAAVGIADTMLEKLVDGMGAYSARASWSK